MNVRLYSNASLNLLGPASFGLVRKRQRLQRQYGLPIELDPHAGCHGGLPNLGRRPPSPAKTLIVMLGSFKVVVELPAGGLCERMVIRPLPKACFMRCERCYSTTPADFMVTPALCCLHVMLNEEQYRPCRQVQASLGASTGHYVLQLPKPREAPAVASRFSLVGTVDPSRPSPELVSSPCEAAAG